MLNLEKLRETFAKNTTLITQDGEEVDILGAKLNSLVNENESINKSINELRIVIDNDQCSENSLLEFNELLKAKKDNEIELNNFVNQEYIAHSNTKSKSKNQYADALIFNSKGELLMLLRTAKDGNKELDNKWGLPGGHVDEGESLEQAVIREVVEETNLNIEDCKLLDTIGKCNYFLCFANTDNLILNAIEHTNLKWVNSDELETLDCIYDLKDRLRKYFKDYQTNFNLIVDKTINNPFDALEIVKSAFDNGQISEEKYLEVLEKSKGLCKKCKKQKEINNDEIESIKKELQKAEILTGGLADNKTIEDIANKHKESIDKIKEQIEIGIKVEMEHTDDKKKAFEIAKDHLMEDCEYYTKLKTIEKAENSVKIGDTKKWHGRNFKYTSSGWSYDDHEKNSGLKTEKSKQKLKIQDFNDDDLNLHAKRTPEKHLKKIVSEGSNPKLREIAQKELNTRAKQNEEHNLYSLMILEEADRDETGDEIHFEEGKHPDDETLDHLTKLGVKHKIIKKEDSSVSK